MARFSAASVLVGLVGIVCLLVVAGDGGSTGTVTITPDKPDFREGERISGTAMCDLHPPVTVKLMVDGVVEQEDSQPLPDDEHVNPFSFDSSGLAGRLVLLIATDMEGNTHQVPVQVLPRD
jgi:hypothetical protein